MIALVLLFDRSLGGIVALTAALLGAVLRLLAVATDAPWHSPLADPWSPFAASLAAAALCLAGLALARRPKTPLAALPAFIAAGLVTPAALRLPVAVALTPAVVATAVLSWAPNRAKERSDADLPDR